MTVTMERPASTSIRVATKTRDILANEASSLEISLAAYLAKLAERVERERAYAELREQRLKEADDSQWQAEVDLWATTDLDGIE